MTGFSYEEYKKDKIENAIKKKLENNIFLKQDRVKINSKYYDVKSGKEAKKLKALDDPRFKKMFEDKNYEMKEKK